ncbi:iron repressor protein [Bifidobacterium actinocoloniiforme DSM 22766]|uniref:Manganese transport regulator n=1 Tax=Bifidobacterium actinocoloniiforme DSM 22766 TaxID=1437605 RepID=A0A086Z1Y7_9BIFI|nr:metal-dependent transcriptional regulator [Bifidobacterium actinocoloniiforme]AKV55629.1 transcriptional regulator [Bifidobacterium actinocoloniiforme DSM 22766]KFI40537.1 iron repressor protein [Bifidobacterium actinocoloniiforme DSM 22766]
MDLDDLSANSQDYLKIIWDLQEWDPSPVQPSALAKRVGVKLSTVSGAMNRLGAAGLVEHRPYGGVDLTSLGRQYAIRMVRRHRLMETFLVETLGYSWDEVHEEAESLEHAVSDRLVNRIDALLGHPDRDPHGDSIPAATGELPDRKDSIPLSQAPQGAFARVDRVSDEDPEMLRYLKSKQIQVGSLLRIAPQPPYSDAIVVELMEGTSGTSTGVELVFGPAAAERVRVCRVG